MIVQRHCEWKRGEVKSSKLKRRVDFKKIRKREMPSVHSKDSKKTDPKAILMSFFFGVANYVLLLPAELQMTQQILKGDLAQTSRMLAVRSSRRKRNHSLSLSLSLSLTHTHNHNHTPHKYITHTHTYTSHTHTHNTQNVDHRRCERSLGILSESDVRKTFRSYR